jgi:hypothetical protein
MDKEKEGLSTPAQDAIGDAAKANVDAVIKVASSAVTAFVDTLTGSTKKARAGKKRASKTKAASASKRGKTRPGKKSVSATAPRRAVKKTTAKKPTTKKAPARRKPATNARRSSPRNPGKVQRAARAETQSEQ